MSRKIFIESAGVDLILLPAIGEKPALPNKNFVAPVMPGREDTPHDACCFETRPTGLARPFILRPKVTTVMGPPPERAESFIR